MKSSNRRGNVVPVDRGVRRQPCRTSRLSLGTLESFFLVAQSILLFILAGRSKHEDECKNHSCRVDCGRSDRSVAVCRCGHDHSTRRSTPPSANSHDPDNVHGDLSGDDYADRSGRANREFRLQRRDQHLDRAGRLDVCRPAEPEHEHRDVHHDARWRNVRHRAVLDR